MLEVRLLVSHAVAPPGPQSHNELQADRRSGPALAHPDRPPPPSASTEPQRPSLQPDSPVQPPDDIVSRARRDVGNIDRELRKSAPARQGLLQGPNNSIGARLERNIAAAAVPRGTTTEEIMLNDGTRYTKVITPGGTYCVWGRNPKPSVITGTVFDTATRTTTCPR